MNYNEGKELLFEGCKKGNLNLVKEGLQIVKDVNIQNKNGFTLLHSVSYNGHLEVVKYLISNGVDINSKNEYGYTSLHYASYNGHLEVVKYLIFKGVDINIKSQYEWTTPLHFSFLTPLHFSLLNGHLEIVKYLISKGADLNLETDETVSKIKKILKPTKEKIYRIFILSRFLHQKYPGVEVISEVLRPFFDEDYKLFTTEDIIAISTFGTQNRPKVLLESEDKKYQHLYLPLSKEYPHLFGYLRNKI